VFLYLRVLQKIQLLLLHQDFQDCHLFHQDLVAHQLQDFLLDLLVLVNQADQLVLVTLMTLVDPVVLDFLQDHSDQLNQYLPQDLANLLILADQELLWVQQVPKLLVDRGFQVVPTDPYYPADRMDLVDQQVLVVPDSRVAQEYQRVLYLPELQQNLKIQADQTVLGCLRIPVDQVVQMVPVDLGFLDSQ